MIFKIIFFHIYNRYYNDGDYKNDIPHLTAFGIVGTSVSIMFVVILMLLMKVFAKPMMQTWQLVLLTSAILGFFANMFLARTKYRSIYEEIKGSKWDTVFVKILSWIVIAIGFASAGFFAYIFNRR